MTPDEENKAVEKAKVLLRKGISLNQANPPIKSLEKTKVVLINRNDEEVYVIRDSKNNVRDWNSYLDQTITYPLYDPIISEEEHPIYHDTLKYIGYGIQKDADNKLYLYMKEVSVDVLRRVMSYIFTFLLSLKLIE